MNLTEWAHAQGIHVTTAYRWYREGTLPVPAQKVGRLILVSPDPAAGPSPQRGPAFMRGYPPMTRGLTWTGKWPACRRGRCRPACRWSGVEAEVGSGMNGARARARRLLADPAATVVVVEHRDRLGRMNTELVEAALAARHRRLVVLDNSEVTDDLVRDMIEVLTSFCARLYGRRQARNRALKAIGCAQRGVGPQAVLTAGSTWYGSGAR